MEGKSRVDSGSDSGICGGEVRHISVMRGGGLDFAICSDLDLVAFTL